MADLYTDGVKDAKKVLGDKADIPEWHNSISKAVKEANNMLSQFYKDRGKLMDSLLVLKQKLDNAMEEFEQFQDEIDGDDFGLDKKNKDDLQKIKAGRKILHDALQPGIDQCVDNNKSLRELDKHLANLWEYTMNSQEM